MWTSRQIIDAVFNYNGGCSPGKTDFLRTMGIEMEPRRETTDLDGIYVVRFPVDVRVDALHNYWGNSSTVSQAAARIIGENRHLAGANYGMLRVGEVKARRTPKAKLVTMSPPPGPPF
jgi:hypothetical protein